MQDVIVYGASSTGIMVAEEIRLNYGDGFRVMGFIDNKKKDHTYPYAPLLGTGDELERLQQEGLDHIVLGFAWGTRSRLRLARELQERGFHFPSIYSPSLDELWDVTIGDGAIIREGTIEAEVTIGNIVGINSNHNIEKCGIGDGVIISPQVVIGNGATIGEGTFIHPHATICTGVTIGEYCLIGPNEVVHKDVPSEKAYFKGRSVKISQDNSIVS